MLYFGLDSRRNRLNQNLSHEISDIVVNCIADFDVDFFTVNLQIYSPGQGKR